MSIGNSPYRPSPELGIIEEAQDVPQGSLGLVEEGEEGMPQEVLQARPPGVPPELLHDIDKARSSQGALRGRDARDRVVSRIRGEVTGIQVQDISPACLGEAGKDALHKITVRVKEGYTLPMHEILADEGFKEGGFAGTGLSYNVEVMTAVFAPDTEELALGAEVGAGEKGKAAVRGTHLCMFGYVASPTKTPSLAANGKFTVGSANGTERGHVLPYRG